MGKTSLSLSACKAVSPPRGPTLLPHLTLISSCPVTAGVRASPYECGGGGTALTQLLNPALPRVYGAASLARRPNALITYEGNSPEYTPGERGS